VQWGAHRIDLTVQYGCLQRAKQIFVLDLNSKSSAFATTISPIVLQIFQMATTQSIHMGPEWMRPQPVSQTTINPPGKNPGSQPPSLGIVPNALRHAEGLKTSANTTTGANAERGALGSASTAQALSANGTSGPGEWRELLWYPSSCGRHSRVDRAGSFFGVGSPQLPHTPSPSLARVPMYLLLLVSSLRTRPHPVPPRHPPRHRGWRVALTIVPIMTGVSSRLQ